MSGPPDPRLHHAFLLGSKKEFRRLLALPVSGGGGGGQASSGGYSASGGPSSGPRSWSNNSSLAHYGQQRPHQQLERLDVNAKDGLGRTILHLLASSADPTALDFLRLVLESQPRSGLAINSQDTESGWTALHRALYVGNLAAARLLLTDDNVDPRVKDWEDMTCWDLFNGTVEGTNPPEDVASGDALFTWGINRNFTLGTDGDRALPERVHLKRVDRRQQAFNRKAQIDSDDSDPEAEDNAAETEEVQDRGDLRLFEPLGVRDIVMSKLHTGVITAERSNNVSLCGFGSNGRLGRSVHTQIELTPIPDFPQTVTALALGQDHTLALTASGNVLSWGLSRFGTLGYPVEAPSLGSKFSKDPEEAVQATPRRILGPLKKEVVLGVAASRCSSACWTEDAVWTWGQNNGHLGYDVGSGSPIQSIPRKVAGITQPVIGLALTDFALCVLLATNEVVCFYRGGSSKVTFPSHPFFAESAIYRPPQFNRRLKVTKVVASGITFACLTSLGDVYSFALPSPTEVEREASAAGVSLKDRAGLIKPQRTWALRKRFTAVRDVALGSDGAIILCTQSGHVYIRSRNKSSALGGGSGPAGWSSSAGSSSKTFKFHRIPYLQRVVKVAANETGAFGAIRADAVPRPVMLEGHTVGEDLTLLQPHVRRFMEGRKGTFLLSADDQSTSAAPTAGGGGTDDDGAETEVTAIRADIKIATQLVEATETWAALAGYRPLVGSAGSDVVLRSAGGRETAAHAFVLGARCPALLSGSAVKLDRTEDGLIRIKLEDYLHLTVLLLLQYLYSDDLPAIWDGRISSRLRETSLSARKLDFARVRTELRTLTVELSLPLLTPALERLTKTPVAPSLATDMARAFGAAQRLLPDITPALDSPLRPDIVVRLSDRKVAAHACVLRSRSPFFAAMYDDADWTRLRLSADGVLAVDMRHLAWPVMRLVFRHVYEGAGAELFTYHHQETLDAFLDFVFDVLAAATELLLDRLVLVCSAVILRHVTIHNVCSLLDTASFFNASALVGSLQLYISQNMETMLESHFLDAMSADLLAGLATFVADQQAKRLPISRSNVLVAALMAEHKAWLALQDIPRLSLRPATQAPRPLSLNNRSPKMSPVELTASPASAKPVRRVTRTVITSPTGSPALRPSVGPDDDLFTMDEDEDVAGLAAGIAASLALSPPPTTAPAPAGVSSAAGSSTPTPVTPAKPIWKPRSVDTSKTDLRSIMSEAASTARPPPVPAAPSPAASRPSIDPTPSLSFKLSQRDRKKIQSQPAPTPSAPVPARSTESGGSPWRVIPSSGVGSSQPSAPGTPFSSSPRRDGSAFPTLIGMSRSGSASGPSAAPAQARPALSANASGEVIRPVRAQAPSSTSLLTARKVSSDAAWLTPAFSPPPAAVAAQLPSALSPGASGSSFASIQAQQHLAQRAAEAAASGRSAKTLAEIQAEERAEEAEKERALEEVAFMRWWAQEEKRLAKEANATATTSTGASSTATRGAGRDTSAASAVNGKKGASGGQKAGGRNKKAPSAAATSSANSTSTNFERPRGGKGAGKGSTTTAGASTSRPSPATTTAGGSGRPARPSLPGPGRAAPALAPASAIRPPGPSPAASSAPAGSLTALNVNAGVFVPSFGPRA